MNVHGVIQETNAIVADGFWHFVCVAWSSTEAKAIVSVDGQSGCDAATRSATSVFSMPVPVGRTAALAGGGCFLVGQLAYRDDTSCTELNPLFTYEGYLNELTVWSALLSATQVVALGASLFSLTFSVC